MRMNFNINKLLTLLALNIYVFCAKSQNVDDTNSFHNYDIIKSIKKSEEDINISKNLKFVSEEDKTFLNAFQNILPKAINPMLLELLPEAASNKCVQDIQYVFGSLMPPNEWALKMVDSYGKPESGILLGNLKWFGEYDECLKIYAPPKGNTGVGDFHGKYCTLSIPLQLGTKSLPLSIAVCLPDSCHPNATFVQVFSTMFKGLLTKFNVKGMDKQMDSILSNATITCQSRSRPLTPGAIVVITFLSIIILFAMIGSFITAFEYYMTEDAAKADITLESTPNGDVENASLASTSALQASSKVILPGWVEKCKPFFNCFCIITNGEKILNTDGAEGQLPCLHGLRFLSMAWVIVCHCYMASVAYIRNPAESINYADTWSFQVIMSGFFSVDTFFVLSGFLVGYVYFKQAPKTDGKIPWLYFYIHRYIRLTPVYAILMLFFAIVSPFMGSGPLWPDDTVVVECKHDWWWNLLYINNFLSQAEGCMSWTWYLANDMQFYIISPLFLITLYKWPKIGYSLLGLFFCIPFTVKFALTYEYNLIPGIGNIVEYGHDISLFLPRLMDYYDMIYTKPYARVEAYLVGLLLAYILYERKKRNSPKLDRIILWIGWTLSTGIVLACMFGLYHQKPSLVTRSFYNALSRLSFSLGIAWVIFVCVTGQGDTVNSILSWKPWIPFSRLTYCAYLVHPLVQIMYFGSMRMMIEFNHFNMIMMYFGTLFISYGASLVTSLLLESPVIRLERLLRNKLSS